MKLYTTTHKKADGEVEQETFYSLTATKAWMKQRPGSKGSITKVYCNGDWEPCGEITLKGSNAVQMSNQRTATY